MSVEYIGNLLTLPPLPKPKAGVVSPGTPPLDDDFRGKLLDAADAERGPWYEKSCHPDFMSPQAIQRRRVARGIHSALGGEHLVPHITGDSGDSNA